MALKMVMEALQECGGTDGCFLVLQFLTGTNPSGSAEVHSDMINFDKGKHKMLNHYTRYS